MVNIAVGTTPDDEEEEVVEVEVEVDLDKEQKSSRKSKNSVGGGSSNSREKRKMKIKVWQTLVREESKRQEGKDAVEAIVVTRSPHRSLIDHRQRVVGERRDTSAAPVHEDVTSMTISLLFIYLL